MHHDGEHATPSYPSFLRTIALCGAYYFWFFEAVIAGIGIIAILITHNLLLGRWHLSARPLLAKFLLHAPAMRPLYKGPISPDKALHQLVKADAQTGGCWPITVPPDPAALCRTPNSCCHTGSTGKSTIRKTAPDPASRTRSTRAPSQ